MLTSAMKRLRGRERGREERRHAGKEEKEEGRKSERTEGRKQGRGKDEKDLTVGRWIGGREGRRIEGGRWKRQESEEEENRVWRT